MTNAVFGESDHGPLVTCPITVARFSTKTGPSVSTTSASGHAAPIRFEAAAEYGTEANLFKESETGDYITAALSSVAGVAEIGASFMTGGASTAATAAVAAA
jgi:hypothetical protein